MMFVPGKFYLCSGTAILKTVRIHGVMLDDKVKCD